MRRDLQHQHQSVLTMASPPPPHPPSQPTVSSLHQPSPPPQSPPSSSPPQPSSVVTVATAVAVPAAAVAASHQVSSSSCTQASTLVGGPLSATSATALPSSGIVNGDDEECHAAAMMMMMVDTATSAGTGTVTATDDHSHHDHDHHHHHHHDENGHDSSGTTTSSSSGGTSTSSSASTSPISAPSSSSASSTSSSNSSSAAICAASSLLLGTTGGSGGPGGPGVGQQQHQHLQQQQQQQPQQVLYLPVELANIKEELPEPEIQADTEISLDEGHALAQALEDIPNDEAPPPEPEVQIRAGKVDESFRKLTSDGPGGTGAAGAGTGGAGTMGYPAKIVHVQMGKVTYQIPDQLLKAGAINLHNPHLLTKDQLEKMITEKDPELEYRKHHNNNSTWQRYMPMFYKGIKQNYVRCLECGWLVLHKASTGTGSLLRHRCKIKLPSGVEVKLEPKANSSWNATNGGGGAGRGSAGDAAGGGGGITPGSGCKGSGKSAAAIAGIQANSTGAIATAPVPKFAPHHTILPQNVKEDLIRQQACVVYKDVVSAELFDQPSFRTLAQMLVNIGVYYGQQENILGSKDLLLDTVLPAMYHEAKGQLNKVLADCDLTFSCSLLRNPAERRAYVAINAYTVASDYYFRQINVKTLDVTGQEHAYVEHLQRIIEDCMARSFSEPLKVVVGGMMVEDGGAAATAYRSGQYEVIPCVVTILWTIMKTIMESLGYDSVRYFERHFFPAPEDSESLPPEYAAIDRFMDAFREPIRSLVSDTSVTISEVVLWKKKLEQCFHVDEPAEGVEEEEEEEEERMVKKAFLAQLAEVFQLHDYHRVAVFLDPKFKGLRFLSEAEREETIATVKALLHTDQDGIERVKSQYANGSTKKRNSLVQAELKFYEFMDSSLKLECDDVVDDEIKQYIDVKLECAVDIMSYWRTETAFPLLKRLCRRILNIPAACDEMKLLFGQTGRDLQKRRLMLSEKEIDMVMYLHQNSP